MELNPKGISQGVSPLTGGVVGKGTIVGADVGVIVGVGVGVGVAVGVAEHRQVVSVEHQAGSITLQYPE